MAGCAHCGIEGSPLKLCTRCKQAFYAEPNPLWKLLTKTPPLPLQDAKEQVPASTASGDWHGVLMWECRMSASCERIRAEIGNGKLERVRDQGDVSCSLAGHHTPLHRPSPSSSAKMATQRGTSYF